MTTKLTKDDIKKAFVKFSTDKHQTHRYENYYESILNSQINSLLEIGVKRGNSLAAWRYLLPDIELAGIDITNKEFDKKLIEYSKSEIKILDSTKIKIDKSYDIIIDDGSHFYKDIIKTFINYKDNFKKYYVIEDAMYKQDFIVWCIKRLGFSNVNVYDSRLKNVKVRKSHVSKKTEDSQKEYYVDLKFIVVTI